MFFKNILSLRLPFENLINFVGGGYILIARSRKGGYPLEKRQVAVRMAVETVQSQLLLPLHADNKGREVSLKS